MATDREVTVRIGTKPAASSDEGFKKLGKAAEKANADVAKGTDALKDKFEKLSDKVSNVGDRLESFAGEASKAFGGISSQLSGLLDGFGKLGPLIGGAAGQLSQFAGVAGQLSPHLAGAAGFGGMGLRGAFLRGGIGALGGAGAGFALSQATGMNPYLATGVGAFAGAGAGAALPWIGAGLGKVGGAAASVGTVGATAILAPVIAALSILTVKSEAAQDAVVGLAQKVGMFKGLSDSAKSLASVEAAAGKSKERRQLADALGLRFGSEDMETIAAQNIAIRSPFEGAARGYRDIYQGSQDMLMANRIGNRRFLEGRGIDRSFESFSEAMGKSATTGEFGDMYAQSANVLAGFNQGSKGNAASEQALAVAGEARTRALEEQRDIQQQVNRLAGEGFRTEAELTHAMQEQSRIQEKVVQAEQQYLAAMQQSKQAEIERIDKFRQWAADAEKTYKAIAEQEKARLTTMKEQFGLQDAMTQRGALDVAKKIMAGGQGMTREELEFAKGQQILQDPLRKLGGQWADQSGIFQEIIRITGQDQKGKQAAEAARQFAEVKVQLENRVNAEIKINEGALADQVAKVLVPQIHQAMQQITVQMQNELAKGEFQRRMNQNANR